MDPDRVDQIVSGETLVLDMLHLTELLLATGALLAKFFASPLATVCGLGVPVASGFQAVKDLVSRKVRFARTRETQNPQQDTIRESLRKKAVCLWVIQLVIAAISVVLIGWLYVVDDIPTNGTPPVATPTLVQSVLLIALLILTLAAILVVLARLRNASATTG